MSDNSITKSIFEALDENVLFTSTAHEDEDNNEIAYTIVEDIPYDNKYKFIANPSTPMEEVFFISYSDLQMANINSNGLLEAFDTSDKTRFLNFYTGMNESPFEMDFHHHNDPEDYIDEEAERESYSQISQNESGLTLEEIDEQIFSQRKRRSERSFADLYSFFSEPESQQEPTREKPVEKTIEQALTENKFFIKNTTRSSAYGDHSSEELNVRFSGDICTLLPMGSHFYVSGKRREQYQFSLKNLDSLKLINARVVKVLTLNGDVLYLDFGGIDANKNLVIKLPNPEPNLQQPNKEEPISF